MCRLYGFRANEPTKVECSLIHAQNALLLQSRSDMMGREHADGWGLASYSDGDLEVEHRDTAAFEGIQFGVAVERIYAKTVIAHVRRATVGGASAVNTHPFRYGRWTFAHNGTVSGFDRLKDQMARETSSRLQAFRRGTTDSEQSFLWILTRMESDGLDPDSDSTDAAALASVVGSAVRTLHDRSENLRPQEPPRLNFLLTNGRVMVASRWNHTLYRLERDGVHDCEICGIPHVEHETKRRYRAVVIASEPITHEAWQEVDDGTVVSIDEDMAVAAHPIA